VVSDPAPELDGLEEAVVPARDPADWLDETAYGRLQCFASPQEIRDFLTAAGIPVKVLIEEDDIQGRRWYSVAPDRPIGVRVDIQYAEEGLTRYRSSDRGETARMFAAMAEALRGTNVLV